MSSFDGLKNNFKYYNESITDSAEIKISLNKGNNELNGEKLNNTCIYEIHKLYSSPYHFPFTIELMHSIAFDEYEVKHNYKLNNYLEVVEEDESKIVVKLWDEAKYEFTYIEDKLKYYSRELDAYLENDTFGYILTLNGDIKVYYEFDCCYPYKIERSSVDILLYELETYNNTKRIKKITNAALESATFTYTGENLTNIFIEKQGLTEGTSAKKSIDLVYNNDEENTVILKIDTKIIDELNNENIIKTVLVGESEETNKKTFYVNNTTIGEGLEIIVLYNSNTIDATQMSIYKYNQGNCYITKIYKKENHTKIENSNLLPAESTGADEKFYTNIYFINNQNVDFEVSHDGLITYYVYNENNQLITFLKSKLILPEKSNLLESLSYSNDAGAAVDSIDIEDKYKFIPYNEKESLLITSSYVFDNIITTKIPLNLNGQKLEINDVYSIRFIANKIIKTLSDIYATIGLTYVDLNNNEISTQEYLINLPERTKTDEETLNDEIEYKFNIFEFKIPKSYKQLSIVIKMSSTDYKNGIIIHYLSAEKHSSTKNYTYYDDSNKIKEINDELSKIEYKYDEIGKLKRLINDGKGKLDINYNESKVSSISSNYGFNVTTTYNLLELPIEEISSNRKNNLRSRKLYNYYKETELLHKEIDEQGRIITYEHDDQYRLDYVKYPNNRIDNIDYDEKERINALIFNDDLSEEAENSNNNLNNVLMTYDNYQRIETITKSDGTKYKYIYLMDKLKKVVQVLNNEEKVIVEYDYIYDNNYYLTDLISSKKYGSNDTKYTFTYDKYGKPKEIKYGNNILGTYTYDKYDYLMFKNDSLSNRKTYLEYLDSNKLKRLCVTNLDNMTDISDITYTYNSEGKLIYKDKYLIDSDDIIRESTRDCYNSLERSTLSSPEILHEELKKINSLYVCSFIENNNLENKDDEVITPTYQGNLIKNIIPYYSCSDVLSYNKQVTSMYNSDYFMGCTCTNESTGIVMDLRNSTSNFRIETRITSDYYVEVNVYTTAFENCVLTLRSSNTLRNGINNIGLRVYRYRSDDVRVFLFVNSEMVNSYVSGTYFNYSNTTLIFSYSGTKAANLLKYNNYNGKLYNVFLSTNGVEISTEFDNIINLCYDYIEQNQKLIVDSNLGNVPYYSNVTHIKQDYYDRVLSSDVSTFAFPLINDYYPLIPNYQSFEIDIEDRYLNNNTVDREFDFDNEKNTYVSKILERMTFNPLFTTKGLVQFDLKIERLDKESKIFRFKNDNVSIDLVISPNDSTSYYLNLNESSNKLKLYYDEWNRIEIKYIYGSNYSVTLTVGSFIDNKTYSNSVTPTKMLIEFTKEKAFGHISQLLTHKDYYATFFNVNKTITNTKKYDELSRLKNIIVKNDLNNVISKTLNYIPKGSYQTYEINSEIIKTNLSEENYEYSYDDLGNILTIKKDGVLINTYNYDKLGQLLSETVNNVTKSYTYDNAGNILTNGNKVYTYDSFKRLEKITEGISTKIFEYDNNYHLNPVKIKASENDDNPITLEYQGKRLTKYTKGTDVIEFTYDLDGNRTRKKIGNKIYNYIYEGNLLIKEDHNGTEIKYLYDDQNLLYGFIVDTDRYYYYKRDIFQNILGIIDEEGNDIVTYKYDAWGNITSETYTNETIKNLNSFKYKGYYYDVETQLFYCNSRYYSPELCRWISPDSIEYLDPQSINGLNLYCYCMNNPIMYSDPSGHMPEWLQDTLKVLGAVAIVVGVTALTVATAGLAAYALGASAAMIGAVTTGAAIGGLVAGGLEIGAQIYENGIDGMNLGAIAIESFAGSAYGAISGVASTTTSAALRLGMRGARVALGGLSTALHGINNGDSFGTIMLNVGVSIGTGILIQGAFAGLDAYTGKLSSAILQNYALDGALNFGANQILLMSGILVGKNLWRNRGLFI